MMGAGTENDYVEIVRHVRELADDDTSDQTMRAYFFARRGPEDAPTLANLVQVETLEPVVLVAPSGTGKTTELQQQARRLRASGRAAAFVDACCVLSTPEMDFDDDDERVAFDALLASTKPGVLFVDAVDELYLHNYTLGQLFRRLQRAVDFAAHPTRLVFSTRNGTWAPSSTRALRRTLSVEQVKLVTFEPLQMPAIKTLASAWGVRDVHELARELEEEEILDLLDLRPEDVKLLVALRKRGGRLRRWTELLRDYVDASFADVRPDRSRVQRLAPEVGRRGLQRVAAAAMLMKVPHVSTPSAAAAEGAISSRRLLPDWPGSDLTELFENPLFVHKGHEAEAVQLPQGPLSHFLAARWFAERVRLGLRAEALREALLVKVAGDDRFEIPAAHQKVVGWLASELAEFRKLIAPDHPAVVLYEGDPDRLTDLEIREGLALRCEAIAAGRSTNWATPATLRRLARPSIEPVVAALIEKHKGAPAVLRELLPLVEHGKYRTCAEAAMALIESSDDPVVRSLAVDAMASAAPGEVARLRDWADDEHVRAAVLGALVPGVLHGEDLVTFVLRGGGFSFYQVLGDVAGKMSTEDLDAIIQAVAPVLSDSTVSESTVNAFDAAIPVLCARLEKGRHLDATLVQCLAAIERLRHGHSSMHLSDAARRTIDHLLKHNDDARRGLWLERLTTFSGHANFMRASFGELEVHDLGWLWRLDVGERVGGYARFILQQAWTRFGHEQRRSALAKSLPSDLRDYLEGLSAAEEDREADRKAHEEAERRKDEESQRTNQAALAGRLVDIAAGDDADALMWAWTHLEGSSGRHARVSSTRLRRLVGDEYARAFLLGFHMWWRKNDVPPHAPGDGKQDQYLMGLTGVGLAIRDGLDLSSLSQDEASRAARLGLYEINSLPDWYGDLARAHPGEVRSTLALALAAEWDLDKAHHGALAFASRSDREVSRMMRGIVLDLLERRPPLHPTTMAYAVDAILTSTEELPRVCTLVRREIERAGAQMADPSWIRLWAHTKPEDAAEWLSTRAEATPDATMPFLLRTAARLEQDLNERFGRTAATSFMAPRALARWARLLLSFVRPAEDPDHGSHIYALGDRDHAQDLREQCLSGLASNPSAEARALLLEMAADPAMASERERFGRLIARQRLVAVEAAATRWTEDDILRLERRDEKLPRSLDELFQLVLAHLLHVNDLVVNDDFSYRRIFAARGEEKTAEREIQLWVASSLRQRSRGLYSVVRENVVDDDKEVDISAFAAGIGHVPIEIKPLGDYPARRLEATMEEQLLGRYMQPPDRRCGVLLLVRRDERRWWLVDGTRIDLTDLVTHLREFGRRLGARHGKDIRVAVIDLLGRHGAQAAGSASVAT